MFRQLITAIQEDDNPRLHGIPFMFFWILSYGLAWSMIRFYEGLWGIRWFCPFTEWLKYSPNQWREKVFIGLVFALIVIPIQAWLIRERYGYLPRFWRSISFIGIMIITGLTYPRVGLNLYDWHIPVMMRELFLWFSIMGIFQSLAMMSIQRKSWYLLLLGLFSASISILLISGKLLYLDPTVVLIISTGIQAVGSGLLMLYLMANPREGSIPKRLENQVARDGMSKRIFVFLWLALYFCAPVILFIGVYILSFILNYPFRYLYSIIDTKNSVVIYWLSNFLLLGISFFTMCILVAKAQAWLMQKVSKREIPHWQSFSIAGWIVAGIAVFGYVYGNFRHFYIIEGLILAVPFAFQSIPMNRAFKNGWTWLFPAVLAGIVNQLGSMLDWSIYDMKTYVVGFAILLAALSSALLFLWLNAKNSSEKAKREST